MIKIAEKCSMKMITILFLLFSINVYPQSNTGCANCTPGPTLPDSTKEKFQTLKELDQIITKKFNQRWKEIKNIKGQNKDIISVYITLSILYSNKKPDFLKNKPNDCNCSQEDLKLLKQLLTKEMRSLLSDFTSRLSLEKYEKIEDVNSFQEFMFKLLADPNLE